MTFFPTLTILALTSRACAFFYMLQCIISITVSKSGGQKLFFGAIAVVLAFHYVACGAGWLEGSLQSIQLSFIVSGSQ